MIDGCIVTHPFTIHMFFYRLPLHDWVSWGLIRQILQSLFMHTSSIFVIPCTMTILRRTLITANIRVFAQVICLLSAHVICNCMFYFIIWKHVLGVLITLRRWEGSSSTWASNCACISIYWRFWQWCAGPSWGMSVAMQPGVMWGDFANILFAKTFHKVIQTHQWLVNASRGWILDWSANRSKSLHMK